MADVLLWSSALQCSRVFPSLIQITSCQLKCAAFILFSWRGAELEVPCPGSHTGSFSHGIAVAQNLLCSPLVFCHSPCSTVFLLAHFPFFALLPNYKLLEDICHFAVESTIHLVCLFKSGKSQHRFFSRSGFLFPWRWRIPIFTKRKYFVLLKWQLWQCNIIVYLQPNFRNTHGFLSSSPPPQFSCLTWLPDFLWEFSLT